jgi:hypothetical protein
MLYFRSTLLEHVQDVDGAVDLPASEPDARRRRIQPEALIRRRLGLREPKRFGPPVVDESLEDDRVAALVAGVIAPEARVIRFRQLS